MSLTRIATGARANYTAAMRPLWCSHSADQRCLLTGPLIKIQVGTGLRETVAYSSRQPWQNAHSAHEARLWHTLTRDDGWHWLATAIPSSFLPGWLYPDPPRPEGLATALLMDAAQMPHPSSGHRFTHCLTCLPTWTDAWRVTVCSQDTPQTHCPMLGSECPICPNFPAPRVVRQGDGYLLINFNILSAP